LHTFKFIFFFIYKRELRLFSRLGAQSEEQPSQPAELAQRRQRLAVERCELQPAKVELFRLGGAACRDAPQSLRSPLRLARDHALRPTSILRNNHGGVCSLIIGPMSLSG
jgi:hypothetical protein